MPSFGGTLIWYSVRIYTNHMTMHSPHRQDGAVGVSCVLVHLHSVINEGPQGLECLVKLSLVTYPLSYPLGETWTGTGGAQKLKKEGTVGKYED